MKKEFQSFRVRNKIMHCACNLVKMQNLQISYCIDCIARERNFVEREGANHPQPASRKRAPRSLKQTQQLHS